MQPVILMLLLVAVVNSIVGFAIHAKLCEILEAIRNREA